MTRARALRCVLVIVALFALAFADEATAAPLAETRSIDIRGNAFTPFTVKVDVGDSIRWTNLDNVAHSVVSLEPNFVSNNFSFGQSETIVMTRPGTWDYICGIHGLSMRGTIIVTGVAPPATPTEPGPRGKVVEDVGLYTPLATNTVSTGTPDDGHPLLWASAALAALALARVGWLLARR